ncbi:TetR/AcrR family transcriptional regulator [Brevibacterium sp. CFH 10365]|uniref:TetR/AcrR family transcriptional regulator n=1 Tax=Brevibacterium sp. CFH 10365 TaxID=2585207 RepID=UPI0012667210|nr:TetR/AcrR family transcriptional regulator [Brevibacterium sp. CFH 10365]
MEGKRAESDRRRAAPRFIDRATVVAAALEVFSQLGFHGASTRQIAKAAGTSLSNLYNYFGSKSEILAFVLEETARTLADSLEAAVATAGKGPLGRLEAAVRAYVDFIVAQPRASVVGITEFRYLEGEGRAEVVTQRDRTEAVFRDAISDGADAGDCEVRNLGSAVRGVVTLCNSMSTWYRPDGELSPVELADLQVDLVFGLVRAAQRPGSVG